MTSYSNSAILIHPPSQYKCIFQQSILEQVPLDSLTTGRKISIEYMDTLQNIYQGDDKVKQAKLQRHRAQFENLKMREDENIETSFLRVDEVANTIRGLG